MLHTPVSVEVNSLHWVLGRRHLPHSVQLLLNIYRQVDSSTVWLPLPDPPAVL